MKKNRHPALFKTIEVLLVILALFLVNVNSLVLFRQFPEVDNFSDHESDYLLAAILLVGLLVFVLLQRQLVRVFVVTWKKNWSLILFLLYCASTLLWTIYLPATIYKLFFLYFSSIIGSYLAIRYGLQGVLDLLTWVGGWCAMLSIIVVIFLPFVGVMQNETFLGSWTGIFWHRNHTGNLFAFFNMIFLLRLLWDSQANWTRKAIFASFYVLTAAMVFGSQSATGILVFIFLNFMVGLIALWLKFRDFLKPIHYYIGFVLLLAVFLIFITNTAFFFGLLGRSSTMTGRIPLWQDLFRSVYLQKPVLGYGYGALWLQKSFRIEMQLRHGWPYQVYFADNGFFDILLNTGLMGLTLFLSVYIPLGIRSLRQAIATKSWLFFVPFLCFGYIFIGNLTYSFLLEVDQFVWMIMVIMVFATTLQQDVTKQQQNPPAV